MNRVILTALAAIALALGAATPVDAALRVGNLEKKLEQLRKRYDVPGMSAAIAEGDAIVWTKSFGDAELGKRPATDDTVITLPL